MSDEQPPAGDGSPIGGSPPPSDAPPPPPVNPYESPAPPAPAPPQPTTGTPYGTPQYGTPQYGTPAYGSPPPQPGMAGGYAGMPAQGEPAPSKAMAVTALVSSLLCCTPVGFVLGLLVVLRSRDGRNHGKGLGIAAMVISVLLTIGIAAAGYGLSQVDWDDLLPVENLEAGECFNADNLADDDADFVENIDEVSCSSPHDAEVLVTKELTADDAESYDPADSSLCSDLISADEALVAKLQDANIGTFGLTQGESPNAGDKLVCVAYSIDGTKLDGPL
jgi:hypothetical protein